mmetsp:Transcript_19129/g.27534  ORF Transcript_19129/g.27534 Transcript_19129/m.27534 type:complete len:148 (-) Transcript_19129:160-603(-)
MFKSGDVMLDSKVLKLVQEKDRDTKEKEKAAITRNINKYEIMKAEALRCMSGNVEAKDMKTADLKAVVKYKMRGKETLPQKVNKTTLMLRYNETVHRRDLTMHEHLEMMKQKNKRAVVVQVLTLPVEEAFKNEKDVNNGTSSTSGMI